MCCILVGVLLLLVECVVVLDARGARVSSGEADLVVSGVYACCFERFGAKRFIVEMGHSRGRLRGF